MNLEKKMIKRLSLFIHSLLDKRLTIKKAVIDGGITPYQIPWLITRFIAVKDFLLISAGKFGGIKLLEKSFPQTRFKLFKNAGHGGLAPFQPERLVRGITGKTVEQ